MNEKLTVGIIELKFYRSDIHNTTITFKMTMYQTLMQSSIIYMKYYALTTSVDVERSFSMHNDKISPYRTSFNENNLTKYLVGS